MTRSILAFWALMFVPAMVSAQVVVIEKKNDSKKEEASIDLSMDATAETSASITAGAAAKPTGEPSNKKNAGDQVPTDQETGEGDPSAVPQVVDTPQTYHGKLARGHALYLSGDYEGALSAYEEAKTKTPGDPLGYYFIGCALAKLDRYDDAIISMRTIANVGGGKNPSLEAKGLFMIAVIEEMRAKLDSAKEAWNVYKGYAQTHTDAVTFIPTAEARLSAFEKKRALDEQYVAVRERIDASK